MQYYYFVTGLPGLGIDDSKLNITLESFLDDARKQLGEKDYHLIELICLPDEIALLLDQLYPVKATADVSSIFPDGFWAEYLEWHKAKSNSPDISMPERFKLIPGFVSAILLTVLGKEELPTRIDTDLMLLSAFYEFVCKHPNEYLRKWFSLDRDIRNIVLAINGRKHGFRFAPYLIGENEIVERLSKSQANDFGLGKEFPVFEAIWRIYEQNNILYRERGYDIYRWKWIDAQNFFEYFSIDKVLGYFCKLRILTRWTKLDTDSGKSLFYDALNALENSFSFPEEYSIKSK